MGRDVYVRAEVQRACKLSEKLVRVEEVNERRRKRRERVKSLRADEWMCEGGHDLQFRILTSHETK